MTTRDRSVLIVVLIVGAIAGAWFFAIAPKRSQASKLQSDISAAQAQLDTARSTVAAGQAAKSQFAGSYTTMARLGEAVPSDDDVPSLIFQVQAAATASRVEFGALTLVPSGASGGPASAAPGAASAGALATIPPGVTVGPAGFPTEPFTFTFTGNFFHLSDFFGRLQRFVTATDQRISVRGRLIGLNAINLGPGPKGFPEITATVSATTYLLPAAQGVQAGATPAGPAGASSQPVSTGGSSSAPVAPAAITPTVK
jgi:type II secretory pathway pseudopilin PulG